MGSIIATPITLICSLFSSEPLSFIYWCKWLVSYAYIQMSRRTTKKRFDLYDEMADNDPVKVSFISAPEEIALESPLEETKLYTTSDEVFFYGVNSKSEYFVTRIMRGVNNEAEAWIYMKLSNGKVYQLKQTTNYQHSSCEKKVFTCGDLQMHYITPMRRWRIFFNGLLRETDDNESDSSKMVHVKFALLWAASSDVFDFTTDIKAGALAEGFARAKWKGFKPPLELFNRAVNCYTQCGVIFGTMTLGENEEASEVYLYGERIRFMGDSSFDKRAQFLHVLGQTLRTGSFVHISDVSIENVVKDLKFGFFVRPTGAMSAADDIHIAAENSTDDGEMESNIKAKFINEGKTYNVEGSLTGKKAHFESKKGWHGRVTIDCAEFNLNSYKCAGVKLSGIITNPLNRVMPTNSIDTTPEDNPLVVHFAEKICQESSMTGGKGSSLGKLTELSKEFQTFIVPNGMVVTTAAYLKFITKDVLKEIKNLENVLYGNVPGDIKESCQRVMDEIIKSELSNEIMKAIESMLQKHFSEKGVIQFAVRSSATGEDTEQMSAAGQMETYLGVAGLDDILTAVKKCWASQFSHIATQYKKQNGQIINSPMAVVIQKMVPSDVAGVLFTCDPLTGNPTKMTITANYGLGESVVSASEEPDTVELMRDFEDNLYVHNKIIGAKRQRIVLQGNESGGTEVQDISENDRNSCCLTDEMSLRLGKLAVKIEKSYRSHRDIEWGFWNNNLYIFQSRPVTSGTGETDFEIDHEMDAPMRMEEDYFTVCNVGEVMPGAFSTLSLDVVMKYFRITFARRMGSGFETVDKPRYYPRAIMTMCSRVMFYALDLLERMDENSEMNEGILIALFGRKIEDDDIIKKAIERFDLGKKKKKPMFAGLYTLLATFSRLFLSKRELDKALRFYKNYRLPVERFQTSLEIFNHLLFSCTDLVQSMRSHMRNTESSSIWNMFVISILKKARGGMSAEVYRDFSTLCTTSTEVESADVPASIERLGLAIAKERTPEELKKMSNQEIVEWLQNSQTDAGKKYREFLTRHGHRCLKEFDLRQKTWGTDPTTLIQLLKNLAGSSSKKVTNKKEENFNQTLKDLGINVGLKTRLTLKYLISRSRQGVQTRELSKSLLIKTQDEWRKGYYHLAKLMVSEGRIPDEDLLFFMTVDEIREILETRSPKIIARANHRKRRYPVLDKYIFPEIMKGFPKPINLEDNTPISSEDNFSMKGIPVSQGTVKAYVRVALTLEEAAQLKPGEILLTYSTDIGWSPYFPILAGVVTELGGLISHGAVVSREYGLPCIAGLHGATRQFQTGDYVLLDGNKGILQRLPKPSDSETENQ
ncbi:rifampicin phosphotransferase-like isoform X4 [Parasteatoda tepidariorum]|uniref:rifampicin phosphotransferase-like isoform X1 n=1 Tax=Parasteatoda tepidariorum TaxID=114398 RepID=UPI001C71F9DD|nr:uncharacterized protein LOC107441117 isoform X3 [Parasteatoda tepidariorum]